MMHFSSDSKHSLDVAEVILSRARKKGILLWSDNGDLRCKAPKGVLNEDDVNALRRHRLEIIAHLDMAIGADANERDLMPRASRERVPLTFSQLVHWNESRLATQRFMRQIASATRLQGPLNLEALRESIAEVIGRHEALRTTIEIVDNTPQQKICESREFVLEIDELPVPVDGSADHEVERWIVRHVGELIDVTRDPLFSIRLLKENDERHLLLLTMQHLISDGVSGNIVLQDILTAYFQASKGLAICLPTIQIQFPDYALWQRQRPWIAKRAEYWERRLAECQRVRFPVCDLQGREKRRGFGTVPVRIDLDMVTALTALARRQRTTLVICVFSAFVALLMRWCNVSDIVVRNAIDGRMSRRLGNTVGYFAFPLYLRMTVPDNASLSELMNQVAAEYATAQDYTDFGYADAQAPVQGNLQICAFNWVPCASDIAMPESGATKQTLTYSPVFFKHPLLQAIEADRDPCLLLYDLKTELVGGVIFPRNRFSEEAMDSFARNYISVLNILLTRPASRIRDIPIS